MKEKHFVETVFQVQIIDLKLKLLNFIVVEKKHFVETAFQVISLKTVKVYGC